MRSARSLRHRPPERSLNGVMLVATAHGNALANLIEIPLSDLVGDSVGHPRR